MPSKPVTLLFAATAAIVADLSLANAADIVRPPLVVRVYQVAPVGTADWRTAQRETMEILATAGIEIAWLECQSGRDTMPAACSRAPGRNEVVVRIVRTRTAAHVGAAPLGDSLVEGASGGGTLATIYLDRVEALARAGRIRVGVILARAIAHELGHLLLGAGAHARDGLMRPIWTRDEVIEGRTADWIIPPAEGARMRNAVTARMP